MYALIKGISNMAKFRCFLIAFMNSSEMIESGVTSGAGRMGV